MKGVGQGHIAVRVMVSVRFPVRRDMNQLGFVRVVVKRAQQAPGQMLALGEQAFEGHPLRYGPVVKKEIDMPARRQELPVGPPGIDLGASGVAPIPRPQLAEAPRLVGR